ncbi:hypothetical protein GZH47_00800 [Paenibacillus rhizovicinus]|uniref:Uncharacterized protein n=1 Tax=Paenibacillus rhizovicinus TaxID=2704463 RepID=A0A6C0NTI6_9BACL|nr:hypothetical protein [Paenibacillus rhizovicinus]QHW29514.1 hypothetical protein GZH47_00800 [Paenibacillus rhizovicinus]
MVLKDEVLKKANVLKQFEVYGYQVAYYLLEDETLAEQAAVRALCELFRDHDFFCKSPHIQKQKTKQVFIKYSLLAKESVG